MVCTMSGWKGLRGVWPAVVVCGGTFATVQFLVSNYLGPSLADVLGGVVSMCALTILLRFWRPGEVWRFAAEDEKQSADPDGALSVQRYSRLESVRAWVPWAVLSVCVFLWGIPQVRILLDGGKPPAAQLTATADRVAPNWWERPTFLTGITERRWSIPYLDGVVRPESAIVGGDTKPKVAEFRFNWLSATGTGILVAAIFSAAWLRITPLRFGRAFLQTLHRLGESLFTIATMLAIAYVTQYSGTDVTLGHAFTRTGVLYPFFAAMLGWLGVALTGSDTSSNALFGNLQRITAERLGLNPILICAANSTGGVMGKMIDAQSIVVASAATGQHGTEGQILRFVFWHSIALASLVGILTLVQAYWLPQTIPGP
jgi:lactate permease